MKKLLKQTVSLLICGAVYLSGCGNTSTSLPSEMRAQNPSYPDTINILAPDFFKDTGETNVDQVKQQWLDEMSERYKVDFNIITRLYTDSEATGSSASNQGNAAAPATDEEAEDKDFIGIVSVSTDSLSELELGIVNETYVPLEGYLVKNAVWNSLPEDFKSLFEIDGHIYALPTSVSRAQYARIIHKEAISETGIAVTDLDTFHDFALANAKKTGNKTSSYWTTEVMDILNAFGLYPGNDPFTPFNYDPTEDCFVDWMTKPAAVEALEYLRELFNAGALDLKGQDDIDQLFQDGYFDSKYNPYFDYPDCTEVLTLNLKYPQILFKNIKGFVMTKNTPQPQETINLLIDMLFGSEQNYLQCWLGSSRNYTLNSDDTITIKMVQDSDGTYVTPSMPNLAGELSDIFSYSEGNILYSKSGVVTSESTTKAENYNERLNLLNESLKSGAVVEIPPEYQIIKSPTYYANMSETGKYVGFPYETVFVAAVARSITGWSVQQMLDEYKTKMLNMGGNFMLDEMNAAIGKKTAYYYG